MKNIAIVNGANLNLLGKRETNIYGKYSLEEIQKKTIEKLDKKLFKTEWMQSNIEGELVNFVQKVALGDYDALIINPGGYSHTSVALRDALALLKIPIAEVHISNLYKRESFRQTLLTAQVASIIMSGLGASTYYYAIQCLFGDFE